MAEAIAAGTLTIPDLRNASSTTRALGGAGRTPPKAPLPIPEPPDPVLGALSAAAADAPARASAEEAEELLRLDEVEELLCDLLLALPDDA